jgi:hypothetical protein
MATKAERAEAERLERIRATCGKYRHTRGSSAGFLRRKHAETRREYERAARDTAAQSAATPPATGEAPCTS